MARTPLDVSILDSTARLFASLDLIQQEHRSQNPEIVDFMDTDQIMEDTDQIMEVPDTPDRLKGVVDDTRNGGLLDTRSSNGLKVSFRPIVNNGVKQKLHSSGHPNTGLHDEFKHSSSPVASGSDMAYNGFKSSDNDLFRSVKFADQVFKKHDNNKNGTMLDRHFPSASNGSGDHLASSASPDISEIASDVNIKGGSRGKMVDPGCKTPFNVSYPTRCRDSRRKMHQGCAGYDPGNKFCTEVPPRSFFYRDSDHLSNSDECHEYIPRKSGKVSTLGTSTNVMDGLEGEGSSLSHTSGRDTQSKNRQAYEFLPPYDVTSSFKASSNASNIETYCTYEGAVKGKDHVDATTGVKVRDRMKGFDPCSDSHAKTKQPVAKSLGSVVSPRKTEQRRLVRNGCISPLNIAKGKSVCENNNNNISDDEMNKDEKQGCKNSSERFSTCKISERNQVNRMKEKGIKDNNMVANELDASIRSSSSRDLLVFGQKDSETEDTSNDVSRSAEVGGWRTIRNHLKKTSLPSSPDVRCLSNGDNGVCNSLECGSECGDGDDHKTGLNASPGVEVLEVKGPISIQHAASNRSLAQASSSGMLESNPERKRNQEARKLMKRPRKATAMHNRLGEGSTSTFDDAEISYVCSSGEQSNVKPTIRCNSQSHRILGPVIEVDELQSPDPRCDSLQDACTVVNDDSSARARQVEEDEILARQLQEQFYQELPAVSDDEIDASIAWTLQHEEDVHRPISMRTRGLAHLRDPPAEDLNRSHSFQPSSVRSTNRARFASSARMAQLRRSFHGRSPAASLRGRNFQFPSSMDLEMRLHYLEVLENAVANRDAMAMSSHFMQVERDFNENDYEMLLALDDNNHHAGASLEQINSLPQSTVQTSNSEEACAICLETPSIGHTIRHLPCLHKFHKECIDPWLQRRTTCPICKSGIT